MRSAQKGYAAELRSPASPALRFSQTKPLAVSITFLHTALAFFAKLGPHAQRIYSDNGSYYRAHAMREAVAALGLKQPFTRPYTPKTNGKAERSIQTSLREWAYTHAYSWPAPRKLIQAL